MPNKQKTINKKLIEKLVRDKVWSVCLTDIGANTIFLVDKIQRWMVKMVLPNLSDYDIPNFKHVTEDYFTIDNFHKIFSIPFTHIISVEDFFSYEIQTVIAPYLFMLMNGREVESDKNVGYFSFVPLDGMDILQKYFGVRKGDIFNIYFNLGDSQAIKISILDPIKNHHEIESVEILIAGYLYPKKELLKITPISLIDDSILEPQGIVFNPTDDNNTKLN